MNTDLQSYVREALARGMDRERIRTILAAARWRREEIDAALAAWADGEEGPPVPRRRVSLSAREAFVQLVLFATLYIFTFDVGAILFALIERWFKDPAMSWGGSDLSMLRWASSGVLTALPIFLFTNRLVNLSLVREPEKRTSGVRRWLTYLTLFAAALVLIGNFTAVVSSALAGELSSRFILKCLTVFAIAGTVFGHYLGGLRREEAESETSPRRASWLGRAGIAASVLALVAGLFAAGAPARARLRQIDGRRVDDLESISSQVTSYYNLRQSLPPSLEALGALGYGPLGLEDPVTHAPYEYAIVDSITFRLCATFATADTLRADGVRVPAMWRHGAGRACFERDVKTWGPSRVVPRGH